jgi:TonB-linked SusC/RagA family outer membrane protein
MKKMIFFSIIAVMLYVPLTTIAQEHMLKGLVRDTSNGTALSGVSIQIKRTTNGTVTDAKGSFSLDVTDNDTLVFSYIGYDKKEVSVNGERQLTVLLKPSSSGLNEVVVVGYGTQKKSSLTGAVSTVQGKEIAQVPTSSLSNLLEGRVPGAMIVNNSGMVGATSSILIRGNGTFNNTSPLYVIDGVVQDKSVFDALDPNEVANISILKDAASASIYGSRAANGIILVTTKTGKIQKPQLTYSGTYSVQKPTRPLQSYNATEELKYINDEAETFGNPKPITQGIFDYFKNRDYNIMDYIWVNPSSQQHDLSLSGGGNNITYYMLGGLNKATGSFRNTNYDKYNFRSNVTAKINQYMTMNLNLSGNQEVTNRFYDPYDASQSQTLPAFYRIAINWSHLYPFFVDSTGNPTTNQKTGLPVSYPGSGWNPVLNLTDGSYSKYVHRYISGIGRLDFKIPFVKGLSTSFQISYSADDENDKNFVIFNTSYLFQSFSTANPYRPGPVDPNQLQVHNEASAYPRIDQNATFDHSYQLDWFWNYDRTFGLNHITGLLVYEQQKAVGNDISGTAMNLLSNKVDQIFNASSDPTMRNFNGSEYHNATSSYVGRLHYEYSGKYIGEVSFRYDGSYIFPQDSRWGFFPAGSFAWIISRENFFKVPFISYLKIRASAGSMGNDAISPYQYQNNYVGGSGYVFGNTLYNGIQPGVTPNPDVTWEKSVTYDGGLDFGLLDEKITGSFDYFYKHTYDILGTRIQSIPATFGASLPAVNYGVVDVHGYEASVQYQNRVGEVHYAVGGNIGYAIDKVIREDVPAGQPAWLTPIGHPQDRIFGLVSEGLVRNQAQLDKLDAGYTEYGQAMMLGGILYKDIRGESWDNSSAPNGKIDDYDQTWLSSNGIPRINYGITLSAEWRGISISALLQGVAEYDRVISTSNGGGVFQTGDRPYFEIWAKDRWSPDNPDAKYPRAAAWDMPQFGWGTSTFWMRNGAYARLKNLTVAYSLPQKWISPLKVTSCQFYFNGTDLFAISSIKVMDPEQALLDSYPIMKSFTGGITITF